MPVKRPEYMEDFAVDPDRPELDQLAIQEANSVLDKPMEFYGGYLMQMMHRKDEILTKGVVKHLMRIISQLQEEKRQMIIDREAVNNVATLNFDLAQGDADRIKEQAEKIVELNKIIDINKKLFKKEKNQLYFDMKVKLDKLQAEHTQYKKYVEQEIEVAHNVI